MHALGHPLAAPLATAAPHAVAAAEVGKAGALADGAAGTLSRRRFGERGISPFNRGAGGGYRRLADRSPTCRPGRARVAAQVGATAR